MSSRIRTYGSPETVLKPTLVEAEIESAKSSVWKPVVATAIAIAISTAMILLVHPNAGGDVNVSETASTSKLLTSLEAKDGDGISISRGGSSGSDIITFSGYYSGGYSTHLRCMLNSEFTVYCDGSPITIHGLPPGTYTLVIAESGNPGAKSLAFSWIIE